MSQVGPPVAAAENPFPAAGGSDDQSGFAARIIGESLGASPRRSSMAIRRQGVTPHRLHQLFGLERLDQDSDALRGDRGDGCDLVSPGITIAGTPRPKAAPQPLIDVTPTGEPRRL